MRTLERRLAPIRDAYSGGHYWDTLIVDVHQRQVDAMRAHDLERLDAVLDEHFRLLEDAYCTALPADWAELFGSPRPGVARQSRIPHGALTPKGKSVLLFDWPAGVGPGEMLRGKLGPLSAVALTACVSAASHADCSAGPGPPSRYREPSLRVALETAAALIAPARRVPRLRAGAAEPAARRARARARARLARGVEPAARRDRRVHPARSTSCARSSSRARPSGALLIATAAVAPASALADRALRHAAPAAARSRVTAALSARALRACSAT